MLQGREQNLKKKTWKYISFYNLRTLHDKAFAF